MILKTTNYPSQILPLTNEQIDSVSGGLSATAVAGGAKVGLDLGVLYAARDGALFGAEVAGPVGAVLGAAVGAGFSWAYDEWNES